LNFSTFLFYGSASLDLKKLGLTTLETRRLRGDLIEVFKILKGYDDIGEDIFFVRSKSSLRGHQLKLQKKSVSSTLRNILLIE